MGSLCMKAASHHLAVWFERSDQRFIHVQCLGYDKAVLPFGFSPHHSETTKQRVNRSTRERGNSSPLQTGG